MPDNTAIEWTDATWNPIRGCSHVSEGCRHCYAEPIAARFSGPGQPYEGLGKFVTPAGGTRREARWTGKVAFAEHLLNQPMHWRAPRRIFVNSMSDLFHEQVPDEWIDRIFAVMALCPQHTFQILTKRPERMRAYFQLPDKRQRARAEAVNVATMNMVMEGIIAPAKSVTWPLPNIWLGTSVEDQVTADTRIPYLLDTPAAKRFISAEPLLGLIVADLTVLDWVIVGGESGRDARAMHPDWARALRDQCAVDGVPFFFKQWGEWEPRAWRADRGTHAMHRNAPHYGVFQKLGHHPDSIERTHADPGWQAYAQSGKSKAGRELDGITHDGFPS